MGIEFSKGKRGYSFFFSSTVYRKIFSREFAQYLAAGSAGRHRIIRIYAAQGKGGELPFSGTDRGEYRAALRAVCKAVRSVFNVDARNNSSVGA